MQYILRRADQRKKDFNLTKVCAIGCGTIVRKGESQSVVFKIYLRQIKKMKNAQIKL